MTGMNQVGEAFACGESFLLELMIAGDAMKSVLGVLEPEMIRLGSERQIQGKAVLAAVQGDIHEIGKSLVGTMLIAVKVIFGGALVTQERMKTVQVWA
jgi:trimethylamine corrinoid protein